ncbi:MAG: transcriptional regulator [Erythrobacter sp.]|jgi:phage repressor protein C with HTH and peptisase S24 domain|uniref:LexA family transcriptional regulator n=1 Tax=Qipengyuania TaxID=1855416 RepID=UPI000C57B0D4|nr:transcriptional regulator [Sphingomonadaceae bacterium]MCH2495916.1 transcriptional regulator [Erythrobacter sp.]|tara:strand:+ start:292 stop:981 length:690 start_codon:yes stop_codon:yes gene_type:complete
MDFVEPLDRYEPEERYARARLREIIREKGHSLSALARLIGRNPAYLHQYVGRGSPRHLDEPDLMKIAEFLGVDHEVIATREIVRPRSSRMQDSGDTEGFVQVPRLPLEASAGPGAFSAEEISYDAFQFSRRWLREMGLEGADLTAIRVEGDSMEPLLRSGDEIFVDRNKRGGEGVFVVRIGDALHVKQVQSRGPGDIALISANDAYAPIELARDEIEVIGRVVWKGGRL